MANPGDAWHFALFANGMIAGRPVSGKIAPRTLHPDWLERNGDSSGLSGPATRNDIHRLDMVAKRISGAELFSDPG
jgi:hypothetical protein